MKRSRRTNYLTAVLLLALITTAGATEQESRPLLFGVVPQQASEKLAHQWIPLLQLLSDRVGLDIRFATAPSIPEFEKRLEAGVYDFAYMNPYHFVQANKKSGYRALARRQAHMLRGIIVVANDRGYRSVEDLAGKEIAFPAPKAFAATIITRSHLDSEAPGYAPVFVNSHDSVYRAVADGVFAGGGGIVRTLNTTDPEVRRKLDILWLSPGYTSHAIAAHPEIPQATLKAVQDGLLALEASEAGKIILKNLGMKEGFQRAADQDWDDVRSLGVMDQSGPIH